MKSKRVDASYGNYDDNVDGVHQTVLILSI